MSGTRGYDREPDGGSVGALLVTTVAVLVVFGMTIAGVTLGLGVSGDTSSAETDAETEDLPGLEDDPSEMIDATDSDDEADDEGGDDDDDDGGGDDDDETEELDWDDLEDDDNETDGNETDGNESSTDDEADDEGGDDDDDDEDEADDDEEDEEDEA
uniref:hypothetical protein n=1 Tax=Natronococcus sp. TaxID=35747 RepID=UPI0025E0AFC7